MVKRRQDKFQAQVVYQENLHHFRALLYYAVHVYKGGRTQVQYANYNLIIT